MEPVKTAVCDVVVPVKNSVWWAAACLEELFRCTDPRVLGKVLVVDDGSTADSWRLLEEICARHPSVQLLKNQGRPGFGGACNFAASQAAAPYLLFLNTDCLVTPGTVKKLVEVCEADPTIGLACPLSNNSPVLTLPLFAGRSYLEMNALLERACSGRPTEQIAIDACTVVGNCLMVTRKCWETAGPFDEIWGKGYGEETDLQFRAMDQGFRGVCAVNSYVFHFGSASFRYEADSAKLQKENYALFLEKWGEKFKAYHAKCELKNPLKAVSSYIDQLKYTELQADVLFILPGISQTVGGVHVVLDICNHLLRHGVNAKCAVLGELNMHALGTYQEPILFGLLNYPDERSLIFDTTLKVRAVAATLYVTSVPAMIFARMRNVPLVNFVQGYEFLFDNGTRRPEVEDAYLVPDEVVVTSRWLESNVRRVTPQKPISRLPIGVNRWLFAPSQVPRSTEKVRVGVVLRSAPDKGQAVLMEVLESLSAFDERVALTVFSSGQEIPGDWMQRGDTCHARLPMDKGRIATELQRCDVIVDASLHEGFGLMPLEAMACGATVIASDSGGVNEFLKDRANGLVVREVNKPERYVEAILELVEDRALLARLRAEARATAAGYAADQCYDRYVDYFRRVADQGRTGRVMGELVVKQGGAAGHSGFTVHNQILEIEEGSAMVKQRSRHGAFLLPPFDNNGEAVVRVEVVSPAATMVEIRSPMERPSSVSLKSQLKTAAKDLVQDALRAAREGAWPLRTWVQGREPERLAEPLIFRVQLPEGRSAFHFPCQALATRRLSLSFDEPGDYIVESVEGRLTAEPSAAASDDARYDASDRVCLDMHQHRDTGLIPRVGVEITRVGGKRYRATGEDPALRLPALPELHGATVFVWVDLSVPADTTLQLYYLTKRTPEYRESVSLKRPVKRGRNVALFVLKRDEVVGQLRLDPGMVRGDYEIHNVSVHALTPRPVAPPPRRHPPAERAAASKPPRTAAESR